MSNTRIVSVQYYLRWLLSQYQTLQRNAQKDAYRIVGQESKDGECLLTVQVIGKSITFKATPQELASDDHTLELFSRKDVRTITYYACGEIKKPKNKIVIKEFCSKLNKMIFGIQKRGDTEVIKTTADKVSLNKEILNNLSQEEAHLVGYTTATEQMLQEKLEMQRLRDAKKTNCN